MSKSTSPNGSTDSNTSFTTTLADREEGCGVCMHEKAEQSVIYTLSQAAKFHGDRKSILETRLENDLLLGEEWESDILLASYIHHHFKNIVNDLKNQYLKHWGHPYVYTDTQTTPSPTAKSRDRQPINSVPIPNVTYNNNVVSDSAEDDVEVLREVGRRINNPEAASIYQIHLGQLHFGAGQKEAELKDEVLLKKFLKDGESIELVSKRKRFNFWSRLQRFFHREQEIDDEEEEEEEELDFSVLEPEPNHTYVFKEDDF